MKGITASLCCMKTETYQIVEVNILLQCQKFITDCFGFLQKSCRIGRLANLAYSNYDGCI